MKPILYNGPMINAILNKQKWQTRRVIKPQPVLHDEAEPNDLVWLSGGLHKVKASKGRNERVTGQLNAYPYSCPYGAPGDQLWVREMHEIDGERIVYRADMAARFRTACPDALFYLSLDYTPTTKWRPSIFMPKWACRLYLTIKDIRVEQLQDISEDDARAEGITDGGCLTCGESEPCGCDDPNPSARDGFIWLWNSINKKPGRTWDDNPYIWVISFEKSK